MVEETDVRRGGGGDAPAEFLWDEQVHRVCAVLSHRRLRAYRPGAAPRRRVSAPDSPSSTPPATPERAGAGDHEVWRVRAAARSGRPGVFDLRFDWGVGRWTVTRVDILEGWP